MQIYNAKDAIRLADGTDLNDCTKYDRYYSHNGASSATMLNCPVRLSAFLLLVFSVHSGNVVTGHLKQQIILDNSADPHIYYRYVNETDGVASNWRRVSYTEITT